MGVGEGGNWGGSGKQRVSYKENMTGTEKAPADSIFRELKIFVFGKTRHQYPLIQFRLFLFLV